MAQCGPNGLGWPKWPRVALDCPGWPRMAQMGQIGRNGPGWTKWPKVAPMAQSFPKWPKWPGVVQMASARYICWKILGRPANRRANRRCTIHPSWISGAGCITSNATAACLGVKPGATWISGAGATPPPGCSQDLMHGVANISGVWWHCSCIRC